MSKLPILVSGFMCATAALAGEPVAGGFTFPFAANIDGTDYPANTTIYAESYPTQFVVRPVVADGMKIFYGAFDSAHGSGKVYPDYTGTTFMLMPPPTPGDVVTFSLQTFSANHVWADANTDVPDTEQDGSEAKPYRVLQSAVDAMLAKGKSNNMVLVKRGDYDEGGTAKTASALACRVSVTDDKTLFIIRAVEGPAVTTIYGAKDTTSGEPAPFVGWGENGVRCVSLRSGSVLQGFTLRDGSGARNTAKVTNYKNGGAVYGAGSDKSSILDCVISNGCANVGVVAGVTAIRCRFIDNEGRTCIVSDVPAYSCTFTKNELVEEGSTFNYFSSSPAYNCTFAGNVKINKALPGTAINSVFSGLQTVAGGEGGANNWAWDIGSGTPSTAYMVQDPKLGEVADGDLRLGETSPCIGAIEKPTADNWGSNYWKTATCDVDGHRLHVAADGKLTPGALQSEFPELYAGELYVDPVNGDDANDGWKRNRALKTIPAAFASRKCAAGTTVYVEPGVYDADNTVAVLSDEETVLNRVSVPAGVALVSLGTALDTTIVGAPGVTGDDPVLPTRCVQLHNGSSIRGFTLTGGHTSASENGGGVYAKSDAGGPRVYDCIITNDVSAKRGGGASACTLHRCYLADCSSSDGVGTAVVGGTLVNCIVGNQARGGSRTYTSHVRNCTFLPTTRKNEQQEAVNYSSNKSVDYCHNTLFLCLTRHDADYTSCLIVTNASDVGTRTYDPAVLGPSVRLIAAAEARIRKDGSPRKGSPAINAGDNALYNVESWGDRDAKGGRRICEETIDLGAVEFDPELQKGLQLLVR